jgi:hypothetical protein
MAANNIGASSSAIPNLGQWTVVEINTTTTWTVPTGARKLSIFGYSAGSSGANGNVGTGNASGGQGGVGGVAFFVKELDVTDFNGEVLYATIGAGGVATTTSAAAGVRGGSTSINFGSTTSSLTIVMANSTVSNAIPEGGQSSIATTKTNTGLPTVSIPYKLTSPTISNANTFTYFLNQGLTSQAISASGASATYPTSSDAAQIYYFTGGIATNTTSTNPGTDGVAPTFLVDKAISWSSISTLGSVGSSATSTSPGTGGGVGTAGILGPGGNGGGSVTVGVTRNGRSTTHGGGSGGGGTNLSGASGGNGGNAAANSGAGGGGGGSGHTAPAGVGGTGGSGKLFIFWRS